MEEYKLLNDLISDDELINDFEFAARVYTNGMSSNSNYYNDQKLIWADMMK